MDREVEAAKERLAAYDRRSRERPEDPSRRIVEEARAAALESERQLDAEAHEKHRQMAAMQEAFKLVATAEGRAAEDKRAEIMSWFNSLSHEARHPNEPMAEIVVPQAVDGSFFKIGEQTFFGPHRGPLCEIQYLAWMIDNNRRVDEDRDPMKRRRPRLSTWDLGSNLAPIKRLIQDESDL